MIKNLQIALNTTEVSAIVGVSPRQLAYWDRIELLKPSIKKASGQGSRRLYSFRDIVELLVICRLLESRVPLQRIRKSFSCIRSLSISFSELEIVFTGESIYACKKGDFIVDTLRDGQTVLRLVIADLQTEAEKRVDSFNAHEYLIETKKPSSVAIGYN